MASFYLFRAMLRPIAFRFGVAAAGAGCLLVIAGCERSQPARPARPPAQVEVYTAEPLTVPVTYQYVGQTEASQLVDVRARVQGVVWETGFEEGTRVNAGQFLFRIDPRPFEADTQIAEAKNYQAKVAVQSAERDLNRTKKLQASASVSQEELDNASSAYETAVASMRLAEANLLKTKLELSYTTVTAPISGMIGKALKKPGDLVDTTANSLLCNITAQDPMYVTFSASEKDLLEQRTAEQAGRIIPPAKNDYEVEIVLLDGTVYPQTGHINFADVTIDPQTGTGQIRAAFPNPDGLLKPGQFVEVRVKGAKRTNTIMVPQTAVMLGMQGSYVYVVEKDKVEMRPVTATDWEGRNWIIQRGLSADENVIITGTNKTQPGAEVEITTVTTKLDYRTTGTMQRVHTADKSITDQTDLQRPLGGASQSATDQTTTTDTQTTKPADQ